MHKKVSAVRCQNELGGILFLTAEVIFLAVVIAFRHILFFRACARSVPQESRRYFRNFAGVANSSRMDFVIYR